MSSRKYWVGTTAVWTKAPQSVGYGLVLAQGTVCYRNEIRTEIESKCSEIGITIWHCCDIKHTLLLCFTKVLDSDGLENTQQKKTQTNKPQIRTLHHLQCEESCWHWWGPSASLLAPELRTNPREEDHLGYRSSWDLGQLFLAFALAHCHLLSEA